DPDGGQRDTGEDQQLDLPVGLGERQQHEADDAGGDAHPQEYGAGCEHLDADEEDGDHPPVPELDGGEADHQLFASPPVSQGPRRAPRWAMASRAISAMPPTAPMRLVASIGRMKVFWLGESANLPSAST